MPSRLVKNASGSIIINGNTSARVLFLGATLVKAFRQPARNQEAVLAAFEESGWPGRIDDLLPHRDNTPAKERVHFTIRCLNACHQRRVLRFFGNGTGEAICWAQLCQAAARDENTSATDWPS